MDSPQTACTIDGAAGLDPGGQDFGISFQTAELQKVATELFQWTERYHIRLGLLPPRLKQKLLGGPNQDESRASISLRALVIPLAD